ncbi:MAG TPA: filamentous hemagglutinin N-terminal domain-containing protein, partial [Micavibrio sp.]
MKFSKSDRTAGLLFSRRQNLLNGVSVCLLLICAAGGPAHAMDGNTLPQGGVVVGGEATLDYEQPAALHIHQSSTRAVIDWDRFDIGTEALTRFHQPSASALTVNRVTGSGDPAQILGRIEANGQIMVLDKNGVFFGPHSKVDVGGLIVSTGEISTQNALHGDVLTIDHIQPGSAIINHGVLSVAETGLAALVAPTVINNGVIEAKLGRIDIGAGSQATIDLYGDGLIELGLDTGSTQTLYNRGILQAEGGTIRLQTAAARDMVDNLVSNSGIISADSARIDQQGRIILAAGGAHQTETQGSSIAFNEGYISARGRVSGAMGGAVEVLGDAVLLGPGSVIDTSGDAGGGDIKIGGDYLGRGATPTALYTYVDADALILNDALTRGDGGRTIIWSDGITDFHG